jgi:hypothetical protein
MPTTWYVARGGGPVAVDTSEAYGVSVAIGPGELCEAVSTGGELVVVASALGVSAVVRAGELCEAASAGGELAVVASAVAGVGDVATDRLFG